MRATRRAVALFEAAVHNGGHEPEGCGDESGA